MGVPRGGGQALSVRALEPADEEFLDQVELFEALLHRCQVLGNKVFDSGFIQSARSQATLAA